MQNEVTKDIKKFILGGRSEFSIYQESVNGSNNITKKYEVTVADGGFKDGTPNTWFVKTCVNGDMQYQGYIRRKDITGWVFSFYTSKKSPRFVDNFSIKGLLWVLHHCDDLPDRVHILHHGKCSVCGRKLTDADSLMCGIGPTCRKRVGM